MRSILLCLIITFILLNNSYSQSIEKNNKRIADTIKAEFLRSGLQQEQIDTFIISKTELISDKEIIVAEIEASQIRIKRCIELIKLDSVYIGAVINNGHTDSAMKNKDRPSAETGEINKTGDWLERAYTNLKQDSIDYESAIRTDDTLALIFQNVDTVNKENYKTLIHMVISTREGKINFDAWVYLDKNYNIGTIHKREN